MIHVDDALPLSVRYGIGLQGASWAVTFRGAPHDFAGAVVDSDATTVAGEDVDVVIRTVQKPVTLGGSFDLMAGGSRVGALEVSESMQPASIQELLQDYARSQDALGPRVQVAVRRGPRTLCGGLIFTVWASLRDSSGRLRVAAKGDSLRPETSGASVSSHELVPAAQASQLLLEGQHSAGGSRWLLAADPRSSVQGNTIVGPAFTLAGLPADLNDAIRRLVVRPASTEVGRLVVRLVASDMGLTGSVQSNTTLSAASPFFGGRIGATAPSLAASASFALDVVPPARAGLPQLAWSSDTHGAAQDGGTVLQGVEDTVLLLGGLSIAESGLDSSEVLELRLSCEHGTIRAPSVTRTVQDGADATGGAVLGMPDSPRELILVGAAAKLRDLLGPQPRIEYVPDAHFYGWDSVTARLGTPSSLGNSGTQVASGTGHIVQSPSNERVNRTEISTGL